MFSFGSGRKKKKQTSEIKTQKTVSSDGREYSEKVVQFSSSTSSIQSEHLAEFRRQYTSPRLSLQKDANVSQEPAYKNRPGLFTSTTSIQFPIRQQNTTAPSNSNRKLSLPVNFAQVPTYEVKGRPKGEVLIINIKKFHKNDERIGSEFDKQALEALFRDTLKFNVKSYEDLTAKDIIKKVEKFKSKKALAEANVSFVIIMSHGDNIKDKQAIQGGYTNIYGSDDKPVLVDDIFNLFTATQCPGMSQKPKVFIFQCCRGHNLTVLNTDGPQQSKIKHNGDMLIAHSTLPGFAAVRDPTTGSWFIQGLCRVFSEGYSCLDVESLFKKVQDNLDNEHRGIEQIMAFENRGFKTCYLCDISQ